MTGHGQSVLAVASYQLRGAGYPFPSEPLDGPGWRRLLGACVDQRLTGFLAWAIGDGALPTTTEQIAGAVDAHRDACVLAVLLERELLDVVERLDAIGVEPVVLKGPAHAHTLYPDPAIRAFGDVDLLVRAEGMDRAVAALEAAGGVRRFPQPRTGYDRRFGKGVTLRMPGGAEVDLHRTLAPGYYGFTVDLPHLFATAGDFPLAGRRLRALGPTERLVHVSLHAALGDPQPRLLALRDLAELVSSAATAPDDVRSLARAWRVESVVASAITTTWRTLGLTSEPPLAAWAWRHPIGRRDRRHLARYQGVSRSSAAQAIDAVRAVPGFGAKLTYGMAIALPRRAVNLPIARWRNGLRSVIARGQP